VQIYGSGASSGHVIAYNSITRFADAISVHRNRNTDIYGNQIWDLADNSIEPDDSYENIRVWGNRLHNVATHHLSFQPQRIGPWYFLYNQAADAGVQVMKWRTQDRSVFIGNTLLGNDLQGQHYMRSLMRNNLHIGGSPLWNSTDDSDTLPTWMGEPIEDWSAQWETDIDYNGY